MGSPPWPTTVRAGVPDYPPPGDAALGGDLAPVVEATAAVFIVVCQVLCDQLNALFAAGDLVWVLRVERHLVVFPAQRPVARAVVDDPPTWRFCRWCLPPVAMREPIVKVPALVFDG